MLPEARKLLSPVLAAVASLAAAGSILAQAAVPSPTGTVHGVLRMARLDLPTLSWTAAPGQLTLPVGAHVLFEYTLERPHLAAWDGALVTELGNYSSRAEFVAQEEGSELVKLLALDPEGPVIERIYENVQVLAPSDFAELVAAGELTESGVLIERGDVDGGDAGSAGLSSFWGPGYHGLTPPWMVPGGGSGGGPVGPMPFCNDACAITINSVTSTGAYSWDVNFTVTNWSACKAKFKVFGSVGTSGETTWTSADLPFKTVKLSKNGGSQSCWINVSYDDADWSSLPSGHLYFTLYSIGPYTPIPSGVPGLYFSCSKVAVDLCFSNCSIG